MSRRLMMRTETECLAMAADMERQASLCVAAELKTAFLEMAVGWRDVAHQAAWQDAPRYAGHGSI